MDAATAAAISINAVLRNRFAMASWLRLNMIGAALGFASLFIGLAESLLVTSYVMRHGFRVIDADVFPRY